MPSRTVTLKGKAAAAWLNRNPYSFLDDDKPKAKRKTKPKPKLVITSIQEAKQAAFNGAVRGLASQEWKQCSVDGDCTFNQGKPGFHCAVGWLIPWSNQENNRGGISYDALMEHLLHPALNAWAEESSTNFNLLKDFLAELQDAHDKPAFDSKNCSSMIKKNFRRLERKHNLTWPKDVECV